MLQNFFVSHIFDPEVNLQEGDVSVIIDYIV